MTAYRPTWVRGEVLARFTIPGEPAAKGNSREIVTFGGMSRLRKGDKALAFEAIASLHVPQLPEPYADDVAVHVSVFYASRRPDLDASLVYDALQNRKVGEKVEKRVIVNDRQVRHKVEEAFVDKARPRIEVTVFKAAEKLVPVPSGEVVP